MSNLSKMNKKLRMIRILNKFPEMKLRGIVHELMEQQQCYSHENIRVEDIRRTVTSLDYGFKFNGEVLTTLENRTNYSRQLNEQLEQGENDLVKRRHQMNLLSLDMQRTRDEIDNLDRLKEAFGAEALVLTEKQEASQLNEIATLSYLNKVKMHDKF